MKKCFTLALFVLLTTTAFSQFDKRYTYYDNGSKKELLNYNEKGELDGICKTWNVDGILVGEAHYNNGMKDGVWKLRYDNGNLAYKFHYKNNHKVLTWKSYDSTGTVINMKKYSGIVKLIIN
jgi:antitoxin component YwqK of YwqJK toxin-antitoxin module